jgi:hypothetical protein
MKTKILLTALATMAFAYAALASDGGEVHGKMGNGYGSQQIVVNNYYYESGYEYASRLKRFHNSYVAFDFYSPLYTETFWYHYTPYTWGVSIYDDWYYYGGGVSKFNWTSGFGGSYWWGYDPWLSYGWNSWYAPGVSYSVNYYLGRPYYHYPMAWNSWSYPHWNASRPFDRYDYHNHNYGPGYRNNNTNFNNNTGFNPSNHYDSSRRPGYSVSTRTTTGTTTSTSTGTAPRTSTGTAPRTTTGTAPRTSTGTAPRTSTGTAPRTTTGTATPASETSTRRSAMEVEKPASVVRITEPAQSHQQTQTVVRTNKQAKETTMRQSSTGSNSAPKQSTVRNSNQSGTLEPAESTSSSGKESGKTGSASKSRR